MVTRIEFTNKIKRKLGEGSIRPNITDLQIGDAIDDALQKFFDQVEVATENSYYAYTITQSDVDNNGNYITIPDDIRDVNAMLPVRKRASFNFEDGGVIYPHISSFNNLNSTPYSSYQPKDFFIAKQHIELLKSMFSASQHYSYSKFSNRIQLDLDLGRDVGIGNYLVFSVTKVIDPDTFPKLFGDRILLNLATAYARYTEAINLIKLKGIDIPGGIKFDADKLLLEAEKQITRWETELFEYYYEPPGIFIF